jgi:hypothetical protein
MTKALVEAKEKLAATVALTYMFDNFEQIDAIKNQCNEKSSKSVIGTNMCALKNYVLPPGVESILEHCTT